jgi:hypothetical protein
MITGPHDAIPGYYDPNDAGRVYHDYLSQTQLGQIQSYPPGAGPSARDLAEKESFIEREMKAARVHELAQIAQSLEHLRQRLLSIDMPGNAERLNDTIIDLMQHWLDERAQR